MTALKDMAPLVKELRASIEAQVAALQGLETPLEAFELALSKDNSADAQRAHRLLDVAAGKAYDMAKSDKTRVIRITDSMLSVLNADETAASKADMTAKSGPKANAKKRAGK